MLKSSYSIPSPLLIHTLERKELSSRFGHDHDNPIGTSGKHAYQVPEKNWRCRSRMSQFEAVHERHS